MISTQDIQGHWVRDWIKAPTPDHPEFEDTTTRVHWMQAGDVFADVRVPLDRPDLSGAECLADLSAEALLALAQAEGFAGHVTLAGDQCTWHREINWHGPPQAPDVGAISFDAQGRMIEAGVLAEYTELWVQTAEVLLKAMRFSGHGYTGVLVLYGDQGVFGIDQGGKAAFQPEVEALQAGTVPKGIARLFDGLFALCHIEGGQDSGRAVATLATHPFAEGRPVLSLHKDHVRWHRIGFDGAGTELDLRIDRDA